MPHFTVERNWIEAIGPIWWPAGQTCAMRYDVDAFQIESMRDDDGKITRDSVDQWLTLHSGDFQHVADFAAYITDAPDMPWHDDENEFVYQDCMYPCDD